MTVTLDSFLFLEIKFLFSCFRIPNYISEWNCSLLHRDQKSVYELLFWLIIQTHLTKGT